MMMVCHGNYLLFNILFVNYRFLNNMLFELKWFWCEICAYFASAIACLYSFIAPK